MSISAAPALKAAALTQLAALFPLPVMVFYGPPVQDAPDDIVSVGGVSVTSVRDGLKHTRFETLDLTVTISCYRSTDGQQVTTQRAYAMLAALEAYLTTTDPTIGGSVHGNSGVVAHTLTEYAAATGSVAELEVVVRCNASI